MTSQHERPTGGLPDGAPHPRPDDWRRVCTSKSNAPVPLARVTLVVAYPQSISPQIPQQARDLFASYIRGQNFAHDPRPLQGPGFVGLDFAVDGDDAARP